MIFEVIINSQVRFCAQFVWHAVKISSKVLRRSSLKVRYALFIVYRYIYVNTEMHAGNVIVNGVAIATSMTYYICHTMNISTRIWVSGARLHRKGVGTSPVVSKISMFILSIQLIEGYVINCVGNSEMNVLYVYVYSVINDLCHFFKEMNFFGSVIKHFHTNIFNFGRLLCCNCFQPRKSVKNFLKVLWFKIMDKQITW